MKKQFDFDDRIERVKKDLQRNAIRHANLLEHLRPEKIEAWTEVEIEDTGYHLSQLSFED